MQSDAKLMKHSGDVHVERDGQTIKLENGDAIHESDRILTDDDSTAMIKFKDNTEIELGENTNLQISDFSYGENEPVGFIVNLAQGLMRSVSGEIVKQNPDAFKIVTPMSTVGIRGTTLLHNVEPGTETHMVIVLGKGHDVVITSTGSGQSATITEAFQGITLGGLSPQGLEVFTVLPEMFTPYEEIFNLPQFSQLEEESNQETSSFFTLVLIEDNVEASPEKIIAALREVMPNVSLEIVSTEAVDGETTEKDVTELLTELVDGLFETTLDEKAQESIGNNGNNGNNGNTLPVPTPTPDTDTTPTPDIDTDTEPEPEIPGTNTTFVDFTKDHTDAVKSTEGNDTVTITGNMTSGTINLGHGNDTVTIGGGMTGGTIELGDGDDNVTVGTMTDGTIEIGDDKGNVDNSTINLGDGNNSLTVSNYLSGSTITGGKGEDTIIIGSMSSPTTNIDLKGGNDKVTIGGLEGGTINLGDGNDTVIIETMTGGTINFDDDDDDNVSINSSVNDGTTSLDNGDDGSNDNVTVGTMTGGVINLGDGDDKVEITSMGPGGVINLGEGENTVIVTGEMGGGVITSGGDKDNVTLDSMSAGELTLGNGTNTVIVTGEMSNSSTITGGDDKDNVTLGSMTGGKIYLGAGADTITINSVGNKIVDGTTSTIDLGDGVGVGNSDDDGHGTDDDKDTITFNYNSEFLQGNHTLTLQNFGVDDIINFTDLPSGDTVKITTQDDTMIITSSDNKQFTIIFEGLCTTVIGDIADAITNGGSYTFPSS